MALVLAAGIASLATSVTAMGSCGMLFAYYFQVRMGVLDQKVILPCRHLTELGVPLLSPLVVMCHLKRLSVIRIHPYTIVASVF